MEERMAQNRLAILQATRDLTARGGFKDAQINAIAELAGISSGLVYRYFNSKNQLLVEVLTDAAMQEIRILESIYREDLPPKEKLFKAVTAFVKRALTGPQLAYSLIFEPVDVAIEIERVRVKQLIKNAIIDILKEGQESRDFSFDDVNTAALCIVGAMTFAVVEPIDPARRKKFDKQDFVRYVAEFCLQAVVRAPQPVQGEN